MKLIITESCIGPKGVHLERGSQVEVPEEAHFNALIGYGKALNVESDRGKAFLATVSEEKTAKALLGKTK